MRSHGQFNKGIDARRNDTGLRRAEPGRPGRLGVRPLAARILTAVLLAAFAALLALPLPAQAQGQGQGLTTFVSNTHISTPGNASFFIAQSFETGANAGGYTVSEVDVQLSDTSVSGKSTSAKIREYNASDDPGDLVATLTNPGTLVSDSLNTFRAPADTKLDANTTYFIMLNEGISSTNKVLFASGSSDDETGEPGWSMGDGFLNKFNSTDNWGQSGFSVLIAIKGTAAALINTPATGEPAITGAAELGQTLSAATTGISDDEGTTKADAGDAGYAYTYQWERVDADGSSNPVDIQGATDSTYTVISADVGRAIRVKVSFTDDVGFDEGPLASNALPAGGTVTCDGVWCGTLYVQPISGGSKGCANSSSGDACMNAAHLSEDEFNHALTDYRVTSVQVKSSGQLQLWINPNIVAGSETLVLHVGSDTFAFQDADEEGVNSRFWNNSGFTWANDDAVELKLTEGPSIDATLSGLALEGATGGETIDLTPVFDAETITYTASVVNGIDAITLSAMKNDSNAMVVITNDGDPNTPNEAELDLVVGANTVTVTVTAEDGTTALTYTVEVTREQEETPALVSNFNQADDAVIQFSLPVAQRFTTGSNSGGYTLTSVEIKSVDPEGDTFSVSVCEVDGDGYPTSTCTALTAPGSFAAGTLVFNAPASTTFSASTTYTVVATPTSSTLNYVATSADGEDTGGAVGWTLANAHDFRNSSDVWVTVTSNKSLRVAIKGITGGYTASTDATLSGLALEDGDGIAIPLAFASDDYEYEVSVVNGIDAVKLTATKNDSNAIVAITGDDDDDTPDVAELSLNVGSNTLTVTVTAEDGNTTLTYTITVTRADAPTQIAITLVSNTDRTSSGSSSAVGAQSFVTGANPGGYTISEVQVGFSNVTGKSTSVRIRENNNSDEPGALVATLTNPGILTDGLNTFTAPPGTMLVASTTYWITFNEDVTGSRANVQMTNSDDETGETGWSIGDDRIYKLDPASLTWAGSQLPSYLIAIKGPTTASTDATLSGMALEGASGGETIDLTPVFDAGTITYTASVVNGIDAVTLSATKNDGNAMVVITNDDDTSTPDEAELSLNVGSNTLTVTVTAEDGSTKTYTVEVTREETPALVSNTGETSSGATSAFVAQSFVTGANPGGYTISEVQVGLSNVTGKSTSVRIRENNNSDEPGALVATLTNPASLTADSLNTFTALGGTPLAPSRTYWITFNEGISSNRANVAITNSNEETSEPGWSIGNGLITRVTEGIDWSTSSSSLMIAIKGTTGGYTASTDATLSGLALEDGDGNAIPLAFASDDYEYEVSVVNGIDAVKLTATKNDSNAMVVITDDDDPNSPDEAELSLNVGSNTLTVTVTAEDGTLKTYTITVTRAVPPNLVVSTSTLTVGEAGSGTFTVKLATQPSASVTVGVTSDDTGAATASPASLTFTTTNWNTTQTVTVSGVNDSDTDNESLTVTASASGGGYAGKTGSVSVSVTDDDTANLVLNLTSLTVDEAGSGTFTVKLATQPSGSVTVSVTSDDTGAATASPASLTFTTGNWNTTKTVTVSGVNDSDTNGESVTVSLDASGGGYGSKTASVSVSVTDDDTANLVVSASSLTVGEAGSGTFTVKLATQPSGSVTVTVTSDDTGAATASPASLTFTTGNWNTTKTVTVSGVNDSDTNGESVTVSLDASGGGYAGKTGSVSVSVTDDDTANLVVSASSLTVGEAGSGTFTVKLATQPSGSVTVTVTSDDTGAATASPASLTFTTGNWNTTKTVTVSGVNDSDTNGESVTVTASASGGGYAGKTGSVSVSVTDDDTANLVVTPSSLTVGEAGSDTFTVKLATQPSGSVTVSVTSDDTGAATASPASLTFTTGNWNTTKTVTVSGVNDSDTNGESVTVSLDASGGGYGSKTASVSVSVTDDDTTTTTDVTLGDPYIRSILVPYDLELGEKALPEEEITVWAGPPFEEDMYVVAEGDRWSPSGVWGDPVKDMIWVVDPIHFGIHALKLSALKDGRIERYIAASTSEFDYRFNYNCHFKRTRASGEHGNPALTVMWGDGSTIWVANDESGQLDAYRRNGSLTSECYTENVTVWTANSPTTATENFKTPFTRDTNRDYSLQTGGPLTVRGIWSDGEKIWVSGPPGDIYTIDMGTGHVVEAPGFDGHYDAYGLWSDGTTMWVATGEWLRAYHLHTGIRRAALDVRLRGNQAPGDMWSDGTTIWITYHSGSIEVYRLPERSGGVSQATEAEPLTASFASAPEGHDGESGFTFRIAFSEEVEITPEDMRDHALVVSGGTVTDAAGVDGRKDLWELTVEPTSTGPVSILVLQGRACTETGALCTADGRSLTSSLALRVAGPQAAPVNSPATGRPTISGTAQVRETLTADTSGIGDADGLTNVAFSYQWLANDGTSDTDIAGETDSSYTLAASDEGKTIKVRVSFTDDAANEETLTSGATAEVAGEVTAGVRAEPPGAPRNLTGAANADGTVTLSWDAPKDDSVTGYQILRRRPREGEGTLLVHVNDTRSTAPSTPTPTSRPMCFTPTG